MPRERIELTSLILQISALTTKQPRLKNTFFICFAYLLLFGGWNGKSEKKNYYICLSSTSELFSFSILIPGGVGYGCMRVEAMFRSSSRGRGLININKKIFFFLKSNKVLWTLPPTPYTRVQVYFFFH